MGDTQETKFDLTSMPGPRKIVVKIGTDSLKDEQGNPNLPVFQSLCRQIAILRHRENKLVLVSSGAVSFGRMHLRWDPAKKLSDDEKAVASMVGQPFLLAHYDGYFRQFGLLPPAQGLLQNTDLRNNPHNVMATIRNRMNICFDTPNLVPVLNENDFVSNDELCLLHEDDPRSFSDNDTLASLVAVKTDADLLVIISNHCLHTCDPRHSGAKPIGLVNFADPQKNLEGQGIQTTGQSAGGKGGMDKKQKAIADFLQCGKTCGERTAYILSRNDLFSDGLLRANADQDIGTKLVCRPTEQFMGRDSMCKRHKPAP